ncbi:MAG: phosphatase PAP2 family protein [Gemmatimonadota bacterium]
MRLTPRIIVVFVVAIIAAHLGDSWAWHHLISPSVYDHDFGRMFRTVGFLPVWLLLALALWLATRDRRRALLLALVPTAGGLLAEVMKIGLRRERPGLHDGAYYFRPFADQLIATKDIGLPSSHALVAFSGAWLLSRMYPRAWPVWLVLAAGCAVTRVQAQAHFLSDVTVAAVAAWLLVAWAWSKWGNGVTSPA